MRRRHHVRQLLPLRRPPREGIEVRVRLLPRPPRRRRTPDRRVQGPLRRRLLRIPRHLLLPEGQGRGLLRSRLLRQRGGVPGFGGEERRARGVQVPPELRGALLPVRQGWEAQRLGADGLHAPEPRVVVKRVLWRRRRGGGDVPHGDIPHNHPLHLGVHPRGGVLHLHGPRRASGERYQA